VADAGRLPHQRRSRRGRQPHPRANLWLRPHRFPPGTPGASARRETPVSHRTPRPAARPLPGGNARQPVVRLPDRLQIALLRASGCNPNDPATQALMDSWPLDQLRQDPAAKRALWPQLRALRKRGAP
jgi:hypothetical protein